MNADSKLCRLLHNRLKRVLSRVSGAEIPRFALRAAL